MPSRSELAVLALALAAGCVDQGDGPRSGQLDPKTQAAHLLARAPEELGLRVDATLGGFVRYLGNNAEKATVIPGESLVIIHYWQVVKSPGPGWRVLTRVAGEPGSLDYVSADASLMRTGYGPASWHPGDIIQDEQTISIPARWTSKTATVWVGLQRIGKHDAASRAAISANPKEASFVSTDGLLAARTFAVELDKAPPPPGLVVIPKALAAVTIDGVANEPDWKSAAQSLDFITAEKSPEPSGRANARLLWDDEFLYAFVSVTDTDVFSQYKTHDDTLWKQDVVELFIDADNNRRGYIELQVNPNNATFDKWYRTTRGGEEDLGWSSEMQSAVQVRGTADVQGDADRGWDAEIAVPWAALKGKDAAMVFPMPPVGGQKLRLNVVWVDLKSGASNISASSWNQITYADFHAIDRMLDVVLKAPEAPPVPLPVPVPVPDPAESDEPAPTPVDPTRKVLPPPVPPKPGDPRTRVLP